jgi:hypothetical protein
MRKILSYGNTEYPIDTDSPRVFLDSKWTPIQSPHPTSRHRRNLKGGRRASPRTRLGSPGPCPEFGDGHTLVRAVGDGQIRTDIFKVTVLRNSDLLESPRTLSRRRSAEFPPSRVVEGLSPQNVAPGHQCPLPHLRARNGFDTTSCQPFATAGEPNQLWQRNMRQRSHGVRG